MVLYRVLLLRSAAGSAQADIAEAAFVVEGTEADFSPFEGGVFGGEEWFCGIIEPDRNVAGIGVADDFHFVPGVLFPGRSFVPIGGDRFAIGLLDDVNLMMRGIGFLAEMDVVKRIWRGAAEGDAEVVIAVGEAAELAFECEDETAPLAGLEPGKVHGAAVGGLVGVLFE